MTDNVNPKTYPNRNGADEPNYRGVTTVSWFDRPYTYHLVRTDDGRLGGPSGRHDDFPEGRSLVQRKFRHPLVGLKAIWERENPNEEYTIVAEPREN